MYKLVYKPTNNVIVTCDTWREMQEEAGHLIDDLDDGMDLHYTVVHVIRNKRIGEYELKEFVARTQPYNFDLGFDFKKTSKPGKELERDPFHNLDAKETKEVLMHTSTGEIIGELVRRSQEYEYTIEQIFKLLDNMKIYDIKKNS